MKSIFYLSRSQYSRRKIGADAERFQTRAQSRPGYSSIEAGDQSSLRIGQWRNDAPQVIRLNANVAVIHHQVLKPCVTQHLRQVADLDVRAQLLPAKHEL